MELFCRGCLIRYDEPAELLEYTEKNRRLFVYSTGIQVKRNDAFTFQLCKDCYLNMKQACKFKKLCRTSDKKFKTYLSLKEIGDAVDLCTYLRNNDDNTSIRFPTFASNSTPVNQKNKDGIDDMDESTCTSIGNFMTDILQGEEMPDTEARIIRQVIEEEADVLDDSLDSHWLQDDMSIDTDFRLDFNFSPFSTPKSVTNGNFYTPSRLFTPNTPSQLPEEGQITQHKYAEVPKIVMTKHKDHEYTIPMELLDPPNEPHQGTNVIIADKNQLTQKQIGTDSETNQIDTIEKALLDIPEELNQETNIVNDNQLTQKQIGSSDTNVSENLENVVLNVPKQLNQDANIIIVYKNQSGLETGKININFDKVNEESAVDIFNSDGIMDSPHHNNEDNVIILEVDPLSDEQVTNVNNKNYYVDNLLLAEAENNDKLSDSFLVDNQTEISQVQQDDQPVVVTDSIDKNLQNALKGNNEEFALEDLLASPAVVPTADVLSTPSIHNLIFGDITDKENHNQGNLEKNMSVINNNNKDDPLSILKENLDECKNSKLGSISSIEKILFGEKLDEDCTTTKQYPVGAVILENKIDDEPDNKSDVLKKIIFGDEFDGTDENKEVEGSYIEALDEFFNSRDLKPEIYSNNENQNQIIKSGTRYDLESCEELYDFEKFYCKICKKTMKNLKSLKIHSTKVHKIMLKRQFYEKVCEICGAVIKDPRNFTRHKALHKENNLNKEYKCDVCILSFKQRHHLTKHKRVHETVRVPVKKHICSECGVSLSSTTALKVHQRKHTLDFVASCDHCGRGFYAKTHLVDHMRTHTGETPFQCVYCSKYFMYRKSLNKHMKMHAGEKNYECEHCLRRYAHRESIIQHFKKKLCPKLHGYMKEKINLEKYECSFCHIVVSGLSGLRSHQRLSQSCKKKQIKINMLNAKKEGGKGKAKKVIE